MKTQKLHSTSRTSIDSFNVNRWEKRASNVCMLQRCPTAWGNAAAHPQRSVHPVRRKTKIITTARLQGWAFHPDHGWTKGMRIDSGSHDRKQNSVMKYSKTSTTICKSHQFKNVKSDVRCRVDSRYLSSYSWKIPIQGILLQRVRERCCKDAADVGPRLTSTQLFKQPETNHKFL